MGIFGDIGRIAREVKTIRDEFVTIKDDVVSQTKDLTKNVHDVQSTIKDGVTDTVRSTKTDALKKIDALNPKDSSK